VLLTRNDKKLIATPPATIAGKLEVRPIKVELALQHLDR
jgi:hypothetical protein